MQSDKKKEEKNRKRKETCKIKSFMMLQTVLVGGVGVLYSSDTHSCALGKRLT
jgi:hypothetical protein